MSNAGGIVWTNKSVLALAGGEDPISTIERKARELVLRAREQGWSGPPFNPMKIADLLKIPVEANAEVRDARISPRDGGLKIEFNPAQSRERVRFSIAHEVAHSLFPDVGETIRQRGGTKTERDEWQLEMLCNLAAAEFLMPIGSLAEQSSIPPIEQIMVDRRQYDVSAEAFLIRLTKIAVGPIRMFCASPLQEGDRLAGYRFDYSFASKTAPEFDIAGKLVPKNSVVFACTAIGQTNKGQEKWLSKEGLQIECVGIPGYPGSSYPRVAGLIRFDQEDAIPDMMSVVHGDVLRPAGPGPKVICQLVNDQSRRWGGGVAASAAKKFTDAERQFSAWILSVPKGERLGKVHFAETEPGTLIASLVGQSGFGASLFPRIRYSALQRCLEKVAEVAIERSASVHMPRLGTGASGGEWNTVEEIVTDSLVANGIHVKVYDPPPRRLSQAELF